MVVVKYLSWYAGADKFECGSVSTNYHALALQVVKVAEEGPSVQRRALDEHVDADVQGGQTLEDAAGEVAEDAGVTSCVCGSLARDPLMLKCGRCGVEEHAACYAIVEEIKAPAQHCCLRCGGGANEGLICTDPKLVKLATKKPERVGDVCTYRRMLAILLTEEFGNLHELVSRLGIEQDYGEQLFRKLSEDGVISSGDGTNFMIYQENLEKAMGKRFGGKWKEGAAEVKSQPPKKEGKGEDEVTNTAGAENEGQHDHDGSRKFGQDKASKSGQFVCFSHETSTNLERRAPNVTSYSIFGSSIPIPGRPVGRYYRPFWL